MSKRIRGQSLQPPRQPADILNLQRVIVRVAVVGTERDILELRSRVEQPFLSQQPPPRRPHIRYRHRTRSSQRLLHGDIPLLDVRELESWIRGSQKVDGRSWRDRGRGEQTGICRERD